MTQVPIQYDRVMAQTAETLVSWRPEDALLYALAIGMGAENLAYVYERDQRVFPTFAVILAFQGGPLSDLAIDPRFLLHGEHALVLHRPLPVAGKGVVRGLMTGAWDKGAGRGAIFREEKRIVLQGEELPLATITTTSFGRAEGGFGGPREGQPAPHPLPGRAPDAVVHMRTGADQALLYRLCADRNPLHADPEFAREAGFSGPILHGLCTYAICARAVLSHYVGMDGARLRSHALRFSAPVFPGEVLRVEMWRDGVVISFRALVEDRDTVVVTNGRTELGEPE